MIKVFFLGTNEFGAGILDALISDKEIKVEKVFTQSDKPFGRKQELKSVPVKILAQSHHLAINEPKNKQELENIFNNISSEEKPDVLVVCDYGMIIPKKVLEFARHGAINIHPSLLPLYRGASPIQSALKDGQTKTGVTIMMMDEKLDHGAIVSQEEISIENSDNYTTLSQKLLKCAKFLIISGIRKVVLEPNFAPKTQDDSKATVCREFSRDDGKIDWEKTAKEIFNLWRALGIWPGIWTTLGDKRIKIIEIEIDEKENKIAPGKIIAQNKEILGGTKKGIIKIKQLQMEGKKVMTASEFLNGYKKLLE